MSRRVGFFLVVWVWVGAIGTSQAQTTRTTVGLVSWVSVSNINQVGGFVAYTHGKVTLSGQFMTGALEEYEDEDSYYISGDRLDFNGAISYRLFVSNRWVLSPFIGLKIQRLELEEEDSGEFSDFAGVGPALGLLLSHHFFSISGALMRNTWSNFSDALVVVPGARIEFPLGKSPWGLGLGYRGEFDGWNAYHGIHLNFYRVL